MKLTLARSSALSSAGRSVYEVSCDGMDCSLIETTISAVEANARATLQLQELLLKMPRSAERFGFPERSFRYEGTFDDHLCALPDPLTTGCLVRLFCLRLSDSTLILGGGGIKAGISRYQDDPLLNWHAELLQKLDCVLTSQQRQRVLRLDVTGQFAGATQLEFEIDHEPYPG